MSNASQALKMTPEQARETPMVDLAYGILKTANVPLYYRDIMEQIAALKELNQNEVLNVIAQLYTEINIDGRFACIGGNQWGLKRWYPVEKGEEALATGPRILNDAEDDDDFDDEEIEAVDDDVEDDDVDAEDDDNTDKKVEIDVEDEDLEEEIEDNMEDEAEEEDDLAEDLDSDDDDDTDK